MSDTAKMHSAEISNPVHPTSHIANCYYRACIADISAVKPGNVSRYSAGHGMQAEDFVRSAEVTAKVLNSGYTDTTGALGYSIYQGAEATMVEVGCNTNLGILLLCFPLAHAAASCETSEKLQHSLARVLKSADVIDTQWVFDAIQHMKPAGLGKRKEHDVSMPASADLITVMGVSAKYDRIARQYCHNFEDIFNFGINSLSSATRKGSQCLENSINEVTADVYMDFLAEFPDSHISRKHGATMAEAVRDEARKKRNLLNTIDRSDEKQKQLFEFDQVLKSRGVNPGTSADLTVAVIYAALLDEYIDDPSGDTQTVSLNDTGVS